MVAPGCSSHRAGALQPSLCCQEGPAEPSRWHSGADVEEQFSVLCSRALPITPPPSPQPFHPHPAGMALLAQGWHRLCRGPGSSMVSQPRGCPLHPEPCVCAALGALSTHQGTYRGGCRRHRASWAAQATGSALFCLPSAACSPQGHVEMKFENGAFIYDGVCALAPLPTGENSQQHWACPWGSAGPTPLVLGMQREMLFGRLWLSDAVCGAPIPGIGDWAVLTVGAAPRTAPTTACGCTPTCSW